MRNLIVTVALAMTAQAVFGADPLRVPDEWIVVLEEAPLATFEGKDIMAPMADGRLQAKRLAATAPHATGAARLNVHAPAARTYAAFLDEQRTALLDLAGLDLGRALVAERVYRNVLNGFSVSLSADEAERLSTLPGVAAVQPVYAYRPALDRGPRLIGAEQLWSGQPGVPANFGEGMIMGVIDSGVNWSHPFFTDAVPGYTFSNPLGSPQGLCSQAAVQCNNKLIGVYDFTTEGSQGRDTTGHGTHVASIAAGNALSLTLGSENFAVSGVAPRAHIISYKVCYGEHPTNPDLDGRCTGSAIASAIDQAVSNGVDVVNYSIGGDPRNPWQSIGQPAVSDAEQFLNARHAGILTIASAGNEGPSAGSITAPANAPWILAVGNSTHDRVYGNRVNAAGLTDMVSFPGSGPSLSANITAPLVAAADVAPGNALACSPFSGNAFAGAIAFIQRGTCTFESKVNHAAAAGAVAVLAFNSVGGPPIGMGGLEATSIPATMISLDDGQAVRQAMAGLNNPTATLEAAASAIINPDWAGAMAGGTSRGPNPFAANVMKPNVTAPGSSILAGYLDDSGGNPQMAFLSGTSMASPHVAGLAAVIKSLNPGWSPAMVQSAIETTASIAGLSDGGGPADVMVRGAGRPQAAAAVRAGLYLDVNRSQFIAVAPPGGDPGELNLPGMISGDCMPSCSFTRTVTAISSGNWSASGEGDVEVEVSPSQFTLSAGESQTLQITVRPSDPGTIGTWADGAVVLTPSSPSISMQRLRIGAFASGGDLPDSISLAAGANRGRAQVDLPLVVALPEATFRTGAPVRPQVTTQAIPQDPDPDDPYDGSAGTYVVWLELPEDALMLHVESLPSSALDVDIYVGRDDAGVGLPLETSERCRGVTPSDRELCIIEHPEAGDWWVLVQNWQGSGASTNSISVRTAVVRQQNDGSLTASGPGRHAGGELTLQMAWDLPAMRRNETWMGALSIGSSPDLPGNVGVLPVTLARSAENAPAHTALFPDETRSVVVPPGVRHDVLFIDVPPGVSQLSVEVTGSGGVAGLKRVAFDEVAAGEPFTPPASAAGAIETGPIGGGVTLGGSVGAPAPGRWYVLLENPGSQELLFTVRPALEYVDLQQPQIGLWGPANRSTNQGFSWQTAGNGFIAWYTYDEDGLPVFYLADGPVDADSRTWTGTLQRFTSNQVRNNPAAVGRVALTVLEPDRLMFSWRLNGAHGSELMRPNASATCPDGASYTGHWRVPGTGLGGTTMIVSSTNQAQVRYLFDGEGLPRWVISSDGDQGPHTEVLELFEFRGYCPYCEVTERSSEVVGVYERHFVSETEAVEIMDVVLGSPIDHAFQFEDTILKLSERMDCQ